MLERIGAQWGWGGGWGVECRHRDRVRHRDGGGGGGDETEESEPDGGGRWWWRGDEKEGVGKEVGQGRCSVGGVGGGWGARRVGGGWEGEGVGGGWGATGWVGDGGRGGWGEGRGKRETIGRPAETAASYPASSSVWQYGPQIAHLACFSFLQTCRGRLME